MIINFMKGLNKKIVIAMGFFDSVHIGHRFLIENAIEIAKDKGIQSAVFTFRDNLYSLQGSVINQIYTFDERQEIIQSLGIENIIAASGEENFINLSPNAFLDKLTSLYNIDTIICGNDFKFGKRAMGDIDLLKNYAKEKNIKIKVYDFVKYNDNKVSSRDIRELLKNGKIRKANILLGAPFFMSGRVVKGSGRGKVMGYPTANIELLADKVNLLQGVYVTSSLIDGIMYKSITNVGARPTFGSDENKIESYLEGCNKNLYDKDIKVYFYDRIRDVVKFNNMEELTKQIANDLETSHRIIRRDK